MEEQLSRTELAPAPRRNLPTRILRAIDNALHLSGLPRCLRSTFAELARYVPQNEPHATIFAHKDKIAERLGTAESTVYRHLTLLSSEDIGLIERLPQERKSRNGRFAVARVRLTPKGAALLGLVESEEIHSPPSPVLDAGHTLTEPTISKHQPPQRTENGLPADLSWLTGNGLSRAGIFALMGKAKKHGKKLSDVVTVVQDYIREMKGGRLYAYLAKLASGPTCFAIAAANERKRLADEANRQAFERKCVVFRQRFRNAVLTDRAQTTLYLIDDRAQFVQTIGKRTGTAPLNDLTSWIAGIESGQLVLATLATERKLMGMA